LGNLLKFGTTRMLPNELFDDLIGWFGQGQHSGQPFGAYLE
jgi:hypothetical protein